MSRQKFFNLVISIIVATNEKDVKKRKYYSASKVTREWMKNSIVSHNCGSQKKTLQDSCISVGCVFADNRHLLNR